MAAFLRGNEYFEDDDMLTFRPMAGFLGEAMGTSDNMGWVIFAGIVVGFLLIVAGLSVWAYRFNKRKQGDKDIEWIDDKEMLENLPKKVQGAHLKLLYLADQERRKGQVVWVDKLGMTVGKEKTNKLVIPFKDISRFHMEIYFSRNAFWVRDLNSTNGTYVNKDVDASERAVKLRVGDEIVFGFRKLIVKDLRVAAGEKSRNTDMPKAYNDPTPLENQIKASRRGFKPFGQCTLTGVDIPMHLRLEERYIATDKPFLIGRSRECHLSINNDLASKFHAKIEFEPYRFLITDTGSVNGTLLNGARMEKSTKSKTFPKQLHSGDMIQVAGCKFVVDSITFDQVPDVEGNERNWKAFKRMNDEIEVRDPPENWFEDKEEDLPPTPPAERPVIWHIGPDGATVGRSRKSDICIPTDDVSTTHGRILLKRRGFVIMDFQSTNGTKVNGEPVGDGTYVSVRDILEIGHTKVRVKNILTDDNGFPVDLALVLVDPYQAQKTAQLLWKDVMEREDAKQAHVQRSRVGLSKLTVDASGLTIGRSQRNRLVLAHLPVTAFHADVYCVEGLFFIRDLTSVNGTRVNGYNISNPHHLEEDDEIEIGPAFLVVQRVIEDPRKPRLYFGVDKG